jgi:hypothetical protein
MGTTVWVLIGDVWVEDAYFAAGPAPVNSSEHPAMMVHPTTKRIQRTRRKIFRLIIMCKDAWYSMISFFKTGKKWSSGNTQKIS